MFYIIPGFTPDHHCKVPEGGSKNGTIPYKQQAGQTVWDKCSMYTNGSHGNSSESCIDGWTYIPAGGENTIVMEVCNNQSSN